MKLLTIGFTKKSAETFFTTLKKAHVKRLVDVRLHNVSQLAGFTKKDDLAYFTKAILQIEYLHLPVLAPTQEILDAYKKGKGGWQQWEHDFKALIKSRHIENQVSRDQLDGAASYAAKKPPSTVTDAS